MIFEQFVLEALGHASYLLADEATGEALVVDPRRDVDVYLEAARRRGVRIAWVMDTHGHNDYLSGLSALVARAGAQALGSAEGRLDYEHRPLRDGEVLELGDFGVQALHTPGHTPEHMSLLVHDRAAGPEPALLLSGGALLVGDLARPDLLGGPEQARAAAEAFCHAIQEKILTLPDHVQVFPTHVAGSLCGGNIGSRLSTTVGYERRTNQVLARVSSAPQFVRECIRLDNLPAIPPYWKRMRAQNMAGVPLLGSLPEPPMLRPREVAALQADGAIVLDTRQPEAFGGGHLPGALNAGLGTSFPTWAGTVLPEGARVVLVVEDEHDVWEATWHLLRIGYDVPAGVLAEGMRSWRTSGLPIAQLPQADVHEVRERVEAGKLHVLDVRQPGEWAAGHLEGAQFLTGAELPARLDEVPADRPVAVMCGSGFRSSVAASVLQAQRGLDVINVLGGMAAWLAAGLPVVREETP